MPGRVLVVGGGPAGLYFAGLYKRSFPDRTVTVVEARRAGTAYGFGVVFSETALGYLREADPASHRHLTTALETWQDLTLVHHGCRVAIDGNGFSGIARLELLRILTDFARQSGVAIRHQTRVTPCDLAGQAVVVGADGLHSTVARAGGFRQQVSLLGNRFIWFGTTRVFDTLSLTFRANEDGHFVAHHYRYSPSMSTFIVECDAATFEKAGLETLSAASTRAYCEALFAGDLAGHRLLSNRSTWQRFPLKQSEDWYKGTMVLIGDALRSVHFSIGSGTRLALEDAIALWRAFLEYPDDARAACSAFAARSAAGRRQAPCRRPRQLVLVRGPCPAHAADADGSRL